MGRLTRTSAASALRFTARLADPASPDEASLLAVKRAATGTRSTLAVACFASLSFTAACSTPSATRQPAVDSAAPLSSAAASSAPVVTTAPPAPIGTTPRLATGVDPARDACKVDSDCQLIAACSCTNCLASRKMHVELCPEVCKTDACAGQNPRCTGGACTSDQPMANAPNVVILEEASKAGQLVLDDPRFAKYVHAKERPERIPMVIAWEPGVPHPSWSVGGEPARFVEGLPKDALVPTMVIVEAASATFRFEYAPEGIAMSAQLTKKGDAWTLVGLEVVER